MVRKNVRRFHRTLFWLLLHLLAVAVLLLAGTAGLTMLGADATVLASRIARSLPVLWVRVGVWLSRSDPGTLVSP